MTCKFYFLNQFVNCTSRTKCSSVKYIRTQMIPIIREALTQMIDTAEDNDVFKYKRKNKFNPCDFLTEFLYNNNPKRKGEDPVGLRYFSISFRVL